MRFHFQFRRYRLPFRTPVRTAHGLWTEREGVIVRLERGEGERRGTTGYGEAAPIPWFGTETVDEIEAACRELGEVVDDERLAAVPARLGCLRNALATARGAGRETIERDEEDEVRRARGRDEEQEAGLSPVEPVTPSTPDPRASPLAIAALLPAGRRVLAEIPPKLEAGFRVFKWKVGVGDVADELALLDDVCAALPSGAKLRLDANGAWDRRRAERWLERCAGRPVEFVEQPCFAEASPGAALRQRVDDLLLGLAHDFPTPIALDESLVGERDLERWIGAGWPGVFVVKPSLLADPAAALARLGAVQAKVVFSSALETAVGARAALRLAFAWRDAGADAATRPRGGAESGRRGERADLARRALGFGVWPLFADSRFDGAGAVPFLRRDDVEAINVEAVWNALS